MSWIDEYMIPFYGLKEGIHEYEFEAGDKFFNHFENPDVQGGDLRVHLILKRKSSFLELKLGITGSLRVACDRCLEFFDHQLDAQEELFIRLGEKEEEISDRVVMIPRGETRINIAQYIYEFSILNIPPQRYHPVNEEGIPECDPEMLRKLEEYSPGEEKNEIDPRWEVLSKLMKKD